MRGRQHANPGMHRFADGGRIGPVANFVHGDNTRTHAAHEHHQSDCLRTVVKYIGAHAKIVLGYAPPRAGQFRPFIDDADGAPRQV